MREIGLRLKLSKTTVATYLLRAREAGLDRWPLPPGRDDDTTLEAALFQRMGRPPQDLQEPDWAKVATELKRKGVTLVLLWQEYRAAHPEGYGYTWFCEQFRAFENRTSPSFRNRHEAGAVNHERVAVHTRRGTCGGHSTVKEHMPKAHQRHGGMTPEYLLTRARRVGYHVAVLVERLMRDRPHPEQGYRSALGVLSLGRRLGRDRLEAAWDRALLHNTVSYASVQSILITGIDRAVAEPDPVRPTPRHDNIRGPAYYQ